MIIKTKQKKQKPTYIRIRCILRYILKQSKQSKQSKMSYYHFLTFPKVLHSLEPEVGTFAIVVKQKSDQKVIGSTMPYVGGNEDGEQLFSNVKVALHCPDLKTNDQADIEWTLVRHTGKITVEMKNKLVPEEPIIESHQVRKRPTST